MNITIKEILKLTILRPFIWMRRKRDDYLRNNNPQKWWSVNHYRITGKHLNLEKPYNLNEKIQYMSFNSDTSEWSRLTDKITVRDYVRDCGYPDILCDLYGTYQHSSEIDYSTLPNQFVLKTNNSCATNIFVRNKSELDIDATNEQLNAWLKIDYGKKTCQPHYSRIAPMILAEQMLIDKNHPEESLTDYKFYCVNGEPLYVVVCTNRTANSHNIKVMTFDMKWNECPQFHLKTITPVWGIPKPVSFEGMKEIATKLSSPFKFVRVDLYEVNGKPYFGEMTFTPGLSVGNISFLEEVGKRIEL